MSNLEKYVELAKTLAQTYHAGQRYGAIEPYFEYHVQGVVDALRLHNLGDEYIIAGYLHDIVEDTEVDIETIKNLFGEDIAASVAALTKGENEDRAQYLTRCAKNKVARLVKLHDAMFNLTNCYKNKNKTKVNYYIQTIQGLQL